MMRKKRNMGEDEKEEKEEHGRKEAREDED
jgi:hypothetical protein